VDVSVADIVLCEFYFSDLKEIKKRPVLVIKDDLPYSDFVGLPISSQMDFLHEDEYEINNEMFSIGGLPKTSKLSVRKPFIVSKSVVIKRYGSLKQTDYVNFRRLFCQYFNCLG
jgi:mRNA interferase MazF